MPTHFAMYSVAWVEVCRVETVIWAHANSREKWQCSEWGERTLESIEHRRSISSCSDRWPSINSTTFLLYDEHKNKICRYNTHKCIFIWLRGVHIFGVVLKGAAEVVTWVFFFFSPHSHLIGWTSRFTVWDCMISCFGIVLLEGNVGQHFHRLVSCKDTFWTDRRGRYAVRQRRPRSPPPRCPACGLINPRKSKWAHTLSGKFVVWQMCSNSHKFGALLIFAVHVCISTPLLCSPG